MGRRADRTGMDDHTRITLLETDADTFEEGLLSISAEIKAIRTRVMATLAAVACSAFFLAADVIVRAAGW